MTAKRQASFLGDIQENASFQHLLGFPKTVLQFG